MLFLPKFEYYEPGSMGAACTLLNRIKTDGKIIAGGTDVLVNLKEGRIQAGHLISVARINGLSGIEKKGTKVVIGSHTLVAEIAKSKLIKDQFSVLAKAASKLGSPLIRNRATIGGNIVTARPAADLIPPLMALGATIELKSKEGTRTLHLEEFLVGPGQTTINPNEILTKIIIPEAKPFSGGDYLKLGHRKSLEIAIVAVAAVITLTKADGTIKEAKIILSAVAPKAIHAFSAEKKLIGARPSLELFEVAALRAMSDCSPINDIRGGSEYRKDMVKTLTERTLVNALNAARGDR